MVGRRGTLGPYLEYRRIIQHPRVHAAPLGARDGSCFREGNVLSGLVLDGVLVVLALLLVALDGLFVAAEFGLVKIRSTQVDGLVREGRVVVRKGSS